jgi:hypothetical protein
MATTTTARAPAHLWIVGILSLLYNCYGCYDYLLKRMHNMDYFAKSMPGVDPNLALAWMEGMPIYSQMGWGLGVWGGLLGAVLLLTRSRYAVWAFAASMLGIVMSIGYQLIAAPALPGADTTIYRVMPYVIIVAGLFQLWYSWSLEKKGALR